MDGFKKSLLDYQLASRSSIESWERDAAAKGLSLEKLFLDSAEVDLPSVRKSYAQSFRKRPFYQILVDEGRISFEDVQKLFQEFGDIPPNLGQLLVERKVLTEEECARALSKELGLEFADLSQFDANEELFNSIPLSLMRTYVFIPEKRLEQDIVLIMADPGNVDAIEELEVRLGQPILPKVGSRREIQRLITLISANSLDFDPESIPVLELIQDKNEEQILPGGVTEQKDENAPPRIIRLVDSVILKAVRKRASDIHFEMYENQLKVKYRIDGVLQPEKTEIEPFLRFPIISRLKVMAQLDIAEKRVPQDGRFKLRIDERFVDFRVSVLPAIFGETVVLRILDKSAVGLDIRRLGLDGDDLKAFQRNVLKPYGMILVAGPTGSGKTTTLYSAIQFIHSPGDKLITIEDPVEFQFPDIVQVAVNEKKGLTFSGGLRSIVRQDPDKILVGEIRDPETAKIAVNAALTGHLVLSSVHANNVMDAVSRLKNMEIDPYEFISCFNLIMAQRLLRLICSSCAADDDTITDDLRTITLDYEEHRSARFVRGKGCRYCNNTGYQGRSGIFEVLDLSPLIKQMIITGESPLKIRHVAVEQGMVTLRQAGWKKVEAGLTSFEEMNRVTFEEGRLK